MKIEDRLKEALKYQNILEINQLFNKIKTTPIDNVRYYLIVSAKNISLNF